MDDDVVETTFQAEQSRLTAAAYRQTGAIQNRYFAGIVLEGDVARSCIPGRLHGDNFVVSPGSHLHGVTRLHCVSGMLDRSPRSRQGTCVSIIA